jgi:hypothetical protein
MRLKMNPENTRLEACVEKEKPLRRIRRNKQTGSREYLLSLKSKEEKCVNFSSFESDAAKKPMEINTSTM